MRISRRLTEGVGGWLQYEFQCNRSELFSEKYLSYPVGQILSAEYGKKTYAEFDHPILVQHTTRGGRKPQIDFAVLDPHPTIVLAVETKWVGRSTINPEHLLWDLIRLELLSHHYSCDAVFILGGRKRSLDTFFSNDAFMATNSKGRPRSILRAPNCLNAPQLRLDMPPESRWPFYKRAFSEISRKYPTLRLPCKIINTRPTCFPEFCTNSHYQIYSWEICAATPRKSFLPSEHTHFK